MLLWAVVAAAFSLLLWAGVAFLPFTRVGGVFAMFLVGWCCLSSSSLVGGAAFLHIFMYLFTYIYIYIYTYRVFFVTCADLLQTF